MYRRPSPLIMVCSCKATLNTYKSGKKNQEYIEVLKEEEPNIYAYSILSLKTFGTLFAFLKRKRIHMAIDYVLILFKTAVWPNGKIELNQENIIQCL